MLLHTSYLPLGVPNGLVNHHAQGRLLHIHITVSSIFSGAVAGEERRLPRGEFSHTHSLLCFIVLLYFIYFTGIAFYQNPKKLELLVVVIPLLLVYHVVP